MKIKTEELLRLTNIVSKASSNNKMIPMTQMIGIKLSEGRLVLSATDSTNYLYMGINIDSLEAFNVCVNCEQFTKLITKFDTEFTELTLEDKTLKVLGNGEYKLEVLLDDAGEIYTFPTKSINFQLGQTEIDVKKIIDVKKYGEKSLAQTFEEPSFVGYYVGEETISTDSFVMTILKDKILDEPLILRAKFIELLTYAKDKIFLTVDGEKLFATDGEIELYSQTNCDVSDYPIQAIKSSVETTMFETKCSIKVNDLLKVLDRLSLFVTPYDENAISLDFVDNALFIKSKKKTGVEKITLHNIENFKSFSGSIDIEFLRAQLSTFETEEVDLYFGNDSFIKLVSSNITKLVCLIDE